MTIMVVASIRGIHVSAYSSNAPTGTCDVFIKSENSTIQNNKMYDNSLWFPNLKSDDAIKAAPADNLYNCIAWAGGETSLGATVDNWRWPPSDDPTNPYYDADPQKAFDNYFGNVLSDGQEYYRYGGAETYSRTPNGSPLIALYKNTSCPDDMSDYFTHASTNSDHSPYILPANAHPHGYDWESKPGGNIRTFHEYSSLNNTHYCWNPYYGWECGYGQPYTHYYRLTSSLKSAGNQSEIITLEESVKQGKTIIEDVEMTSSELEQIRSKISYINKESQDSFTAKYARLEGAWNAVKQHGGNPLKFKNTIQFKDLLTFCDSVGSSIWPLMFNKFLGDQNFLSKILVVEITRKNNEELIKNVRIQISKNKTDKNGSLSVPASFKGTKIYIKNLLSKNETKKNLNFLSNPSIEFSSYNVVLKQNYPNPFNNNTNFEFEVSKTSKITLEIFDMNGNLIEKILNSEIYDPGTHILNWNAKGLSKGSYMYKLIVDDKSFTKILIIN